MKIDTIRSGGHSQGGLDQTGGTLSGPLLLSRDPQVPMEAATKRYIDNNVSSLNASNVTTGTLPIARLPGFSGDVNSEAGSNSILLSNTGVTAGEYGKIVVDAKGRATNGTGLGNSDIPNINFNKIVSDKPTTLAGYGIIDGITVSGGTLTGALNLSSNPSSSDNLVPKQYVDGMLNNLSSAKTGDVVRKAYSTTPAGFLKCNGAEVDKTTYADLYAIIGESNNSYNIIGSGKPWQQQYEFNKSQFADIGPWSAGTNLPVAIHAAMVFVTKNRVYLCGGFNASSTVSTVYTAPINVDGTLGAWSTSTSLPINIYVGQAVVIKNRVHLIGGATGVSTASAAVYSAAINSDGTIGSWVLGTSLPSGLGWSQSIVTNSRVYLLGGYTGTALVSTVYSAPINSDGTLGTWVTDTSIPTAMNGTTAIVTKNRVYICGGNWGTGVSIPDVYTAPINADGTLGTWTTGTSLPGGVTACSPIITNNRVYLLGSYTNNTSVATVYTAPINADGTLGTWTTGSALPGGLAWSHVITTKSRTYLLGGVVTGVVVSTVYTAAFSGGLNDYSLYYDEDQTNYMTPGSGQPWRLQYQINNTQIGDITGWSNAGNLPVALASAIPLVTKNRVYLIGGNRASTTYNSAVYMSIINADGTLGTWSTGTAFPVNIAGAFAIVTKNRVYVIGGVVNGTASSSVYTAPINSDGTIGTWSATTSLPAIISFCNVFVTKNRVYVINGSNTNVYTAPINADGTLGAWGTGTSLPVSVGGSQAVVTKNRVYLLGGYTSTPISTIYCATINSNGILGNWFVSGSLPGGLSHSQAIVTKNMVYLLGGYSGVNNVSTVYTAPILNDGTLGTWTTGTSLPGVLNQSSVIITKNRVYLLGGDTNNNAAYTAVMYTATISDGMNDYSEYYDGTIIPFEPVDPTTTFKLPDMSTTDINGIYHYIKY